ncbi:MAG TPA: hypothetical protein VHV82_03285 [Sporichthyaceae bacterium]|nr:hypothetical protein [Sporichthyaceae bacterium]
MSMHKAHALQDAADPVAADVTAGRNLPRAVMVRPPYSPLVRFYLVTVGFMPVTLIATSCFGVPLKILALCLMLPAVIGVAILAALRPWVRRLVLVALVAGPIATLLYDSFRYCFNASGLINRDPIPHIGIALGLHGTGPGMHAGWICGYLWRYLLNGTGLAIAFSALGLRGVRAGMAFGLFVVSGLMVVLLISPHGQQTLWQISPWTVIMGTGGHIIYGGVLGTIRARAAKTSRWSLPYDDQPDPRTLTFVPESWLSTPDPGTPTFVPESWLSTSEPAPLTDLVEASPRQWGRALAGTGLHRRT